VDLSRQSVNGVTAVGELAPACTKQLRRIRISHRNIGHDWHFSDQQKKVLRHYYNANNLLVDCLNISCEVTPAVRSHIEETLLLPIALIEQRSSC
jgi:hypothetical protein